MNDEQINELIKQMTRIADELEFFHDNDSFLRGIVSYLSRIHTELQGIRTND